MTDDTNTPEHELGFLLAHDGVIESPLYLRFEAACEAAAGADYAEVLAEACRLAVDLNSDLQVSGLDLLDHDVRHFTRTTPIDDDDEGGSGLDAFAGDGGGGGLFAGLLRSGAES